MQFDGVTLSGGFQIQLPPTNLPTAGWYAGGFNNPSMYSSINRLTFATDTVNTSTRGPLSSELTLFAGTGTNTNGWFGGGYTTSFVITSSVQRITFASDTAVSSTRGPLSSSKYSPGATTDGTTYGWLGGGYDPSLTPGIKRTSTVDRITYAADTITASIRGPLSVPVSSVSGTGTTNYGYIVGGYSNIGLESVIQRITYATDTATASLRGPLTNTHFRSSASTDGIYGWIAGNSGNGITSYVDRITYANDTATTSTRGPLSSASYGGAASGDTTYGWFALGALGPLKVSTITRITYATDTAVSTDRSNTSIARSFLAGVSGIQ
jgi:hypothetical protein